VAAATGSDAGAPPGGGRTMSVPALGAVVAAVVMFAVLLVSYYN
jgi:hypothetical protein